MGSRQQNLSQNNGATMKDDSQYSGRIPLDEQPPLLHERKPNPFSYACPNCGYDGLWSKGETACCCCDDARGHRFSPWYRTDGTCRKCGKHLLESQPDYVADLDAMLDSILKRPGMHATTIPAMESVLWALLTLRGTWRPPEDAAKVVYQREKKQLGAVGPEVVCERYLTTRPEEDEQAVAFYRSWVEGTREHKDHNDAGDKT